MKCGSCNYELEGLKQGVCPECGAPFDPDAELFAPTPRRARFPSPRVPFVRMLALQFFSWWIFFAGGHGAGTSGLLLFFAGRVLQDAPPLLSGLVMMNCLAQVMIPISIAVRRPTFRSIAIVFSAIPVVGLVLFFAIGDPAYAWVPICTAIPYLALLAWNIRVEFGEL